MRALALAVVLLATPSIAAGQATGMLRITVTLPDGAGRPTPVARHLLLVSDNPASTVPRRVTTASDGTASMALPPGNYTVESDRPVAFLGQEFSWTQTLDVAAGRDTSLALTAANAAVGAVSAAAPALTTTPADPADVLSLWQAGVVSLWTPTRRASGFVVDARGLVATNQQVVARATTVEVQLSPTVKLAARVLAADPVNDVAILWIDPKALADVAPLPLGCSSAPTALVNRQEVTALGTPAGRGTRATTGTLTRTAARAMLADFSLDDDATGGPVFAAGGDLIGLTSFLGVREGDPRSESRVVRLDAVCEVLASAATKMTNAAPPSATPLPVEPATVIPPDVLDGMMKTRAGNLSPFAAASTGFDLAFLTPLQVYAGLRSMDFANWSDYVSETPSVLLVRVTPKQVESVWTKVARGAAMTQGIVLPPITRVRAGFARLRAFCGETEVTPIHPFLLERRVSDTDAVYEGLYVFDPEAVSSTCGTVRLEIYSDRAPDKPDVAMVDPKVLGQIWADFAAYRERK